MPVNDSTPNLSSQTPLEGILNLPNQAFRALVSRPWLLGYALMVQAVFQGVIIAHWGVVGNILTIIICSLFLVLVYLQTRSPGDVVNTIFGTRTQQLAALFVFCLVVTMVWGNHTVPAFLSMGQKITFLLIMAAVIYTIREKERLSSFCWTILVASALLYTVILIQYFFGLDLTFIDENWYVSRDFCEKINRVHMHRMTIAQLYGINRLAFYSILPVAAGIGLILTSERPHHKLVAIVLVTIIIFTIIVSGSRSGTIAILVTFLTFFLLNLKSRHHIANFMIAVSIILCSATLLLWILPVGITSLERIAENNSLSRILSDHAFKSSICKDDMVPGKNSMTAGVTENQPAYTSRNRFKKGLSIDEYRTRNWKIALEVFLENPWGGSGFRTSTDEVLARVPDARFTDPHNGYLMVLSEAGLLGAIPLSALLLYSLVMLFRPVPGMAGASVVWKGAFLSALAGMLAANLTSSYLFERHLWVVFACAAMVEIWKRGSTVQQRGVKQPSVIR